MNDKELKLSLLKAIMEFGSENDRRDPIEKAKQLYQWINSEVAGEVKAPAKRKVG